MIASVTDLSSHLTGAHRTWLDPEGFSEATLGKAPIDTPRRAMGDLLGNAVRFGVPGEVKQQDGSEVKSVELERLIAEGKTLVERQGTFELMRDQAPSTTKGTPARHGSRAADRGSTTAI